MLPRSVVPGQELLSLSTLHAARLARCLCLPVCTFEYGSWGNVGQAQPFTYALISGEGGGGVGYCVYDFALIELNFVEEQNADILELGQAQAANEVAELAAGDNRLLILAVIFVPALGWVNTTPFFRTLLDRHFTYKRCKARLGRGLRSTLAGRVPAFP